MIITSKTFLITGGASGLGLATAQMIVDNGGHVVLLDINPIAGILAETQLGPNARFIQTDVTSEDSVQHAITSALDQFGGIHGAINCAGVAPGERVVGKTGPHSLANFSKTIMINLVGTFNVIRLSAAAIQTNEPGEGGERGVLISTASVAAFRGRGRRPSSRARPSRS